VNQTTPVTTATKATTRMRASGRRRDTGTPSDGHVGAVRSRDAGGAVRIVTDTDRVP
jgi:hypothetical protein